MNDDEKLLPLCLPEQEIAERLAKDVQRSLKWRALCELAAEEPQQADQSLRAGLSGGT